jgi:nucleoporin NUP159
MASGNAPSIELAPEVPEVETEVATIDRELMPQKTNKSQHLGFKVLNQGHQGPKRVKILPQPWPTERLPPASANLLSVASKPGLLAAAGPKILVVTSTDGVRKAFGNKTASDIDKDESALSGRDVDVVSDFTPDVTISTADLRHVAFSTDGDFLVTSAEETGGLAVYDVAAIMRQGKKDPGNQISTDGIPVRALYPNPATEFGQYFAVLLDSGKLEIINVSNGKKLTIREDGVNCTTWSTRGKAVVAGLADGTLAVHMSSGELKGIIPRPPNLDESYEVTGVSWLNTDEFLVVHSLKDNEQPNEPNTYHFVKSNKWTSFTFHPFGYDPLPAAFEPPNRALPARLSSMRLRNWKPDLDEMLIITSSHTDTIGVLASTSGKISPNQVNTNELMVVGVDDTKRATVPRTAYGDDEQDSVFIGEALDLSAKEKILRPIPAMEEINEAPWPLPAYMALTHEGLLAAWWVMWNRSIEAGERYPGIIHKSESTQSATASTPAASRIPTPSTSTGSPFAKASDATPKTPFGKSTASFGTPGTSAIPTFGNAGTSSPTPALMKPTPPGFGTPGFGTAPAALPAPTFGKPAQPAFGAPSSIGKPAQPAFGAPSAIGKPAQPAFGAPSAIGKPAQPAFGAPSAVGAGSGFGSTGGMGNKSSPWGAPTPAAEQKANPFASATGGTSGFAKFGQTGGGSSFSSFGSNNGAQSGFGSLGQGQQKSGFGALKTEPSFGSTVTVGTGTGSSLPSWANTPAQTSSSIFGQDNQSSFNTASFESKQSDMSDAQDRKRDEATPTPQAPPKSQDMFGLAGGFKLGTTFSSDGTAQDDPAKPAAPANGSFFGSDFSNMLPRNGMQPPATPAKEAPENFSTTPATQPKQGSYFPSETPRAPPPAQEESSSPVDDAPLPPDFTKAKPSKLDDDAPLPPDFINTNLPKSKDDDLPPLAGSPGVEVEAPSSSVEASPIDREDSQEDEEDYSDEEESGEDEGEEEEEVEEIATPGPVRSLQSRMTFPPAPTPPVNRTESPPQPVFGQPAKPAGSQPSFESSSLFGQQPNQTPFSIKPDQSSTTQKPNFPPPTNRASNLRSPSPVRLASSSRVRREPMFEPGASLSSSIQGSKPPTPQPQVSDLEDEEDERMRAQLAQPIEPSRELEEFVAYQNYTGGQSPNKTGHAAQIEMIYKDINGMVDALGWNARSIKSFTQYHQQPQSGHQIDRDMLDDVQAEGLHGSWFEKFTLAEIQALGGLEKDLEQGLDGGRVQDVFDKLSQLARLLREKAKLMTRLNDIRRQIITRKDPEKAEALRNAPLPKELADGQKALRKAYAQVLTSIKQAEDEVMILRSKLASQNAQNGKTSGVPTMEKVKQTVIKMASIAEQKNNEILILEAQMRKIGLADPSRPSSFSPRNNGTGTPRRSRHGTSLRNSIADTPYTTPPTGRNKMSLSELNRRALSPEVEASPTPTKGYGLFYTPEGSPTPGKEIARLSDLVDENMDSLRETARRRRVVAKGLKEALLERGIKSTKV